MQELLDYLTVTRIKRNYFVAGLTLCQFKGQDGHSDGTCQPDRVHHCKTLTLIFLMLVVTHQLLGSPCF